MTQLEREIHAIYAVKVGAPKLGLILLGAGLAGFVGISIFAYIVGRIL